MCAYLTPEPQAQTNKGMLMVAVVLIAMLCALFFGNGGGGVPQRHR